MARPPKPITFGVVIRSYCRPDLLRQALESVVAQTRPPEQVVVSDDGSPAEVANMVAAEFPAVSFIGGANLGRGIAANRGIAELSTDFVCFMDDDDMWHREKLAQVADYLEQSPDCEALNHYFWYFASPQVDDVELPGRPDFRASTLTECHAQAASVAPVSDLSYLCINGDSFNALQVHNRGAFSTTVVSRKLAIAAGGLHPELICAEDWSFFRNVARLTEWHTIPHRLGFQRLHEGQSTTAEAANAAAIMSAYLLNWYGGRSRREQASTQSARIALSAAGGDYARRVGEITWRLQRTGNRPEARTVRQLARPLLIKRSDRLLARLPPRLALAAGRVAIHR